MQTNVRQKNFVNRKPKNNGNVKNVEKNKVKKTPVEFESVIIVDDQDDFRKPTGALYVTGGENIDKHILNYVTKNQKRINQIVWTRDWHPKKHMSFKENGGIWPNHCEQNTSGANVSKELYDAIAKLGIPQVIVNKGTDPEYEEYGAFEVCATFHHLHPNDKPQVKNCYFRNHDGTSGCRIINDNIVVCGIAGDYCVKETMKNLLKHWRSFKIKVLTDGIASIDGGTALNEFITENNLKTV